MLDQLCLFNSKIVIYQYYPQQMLISHKILTMIYHTK